MIGLVLVFEVMESQGNYMEEIYDPGEYKLTWMLCCYFSYIVVYKFNVLASVLVVCNIVYASARSNSQRVVFCKN
jgi:hypothetical protein